MPQPDDRPKTTMPCPYAAHYRVECCNVMPCRVHMERTSSAPLRVTGIGADAENDRSLILYLSRPATNDEIRVLHDAARFAMEGYA